MIRKLISLLLCSLGLFVLMGAGEEQDQAVPETENAFMVKTFEYISAAVGTDFTEAKEVESVTTTPTQAPVQIAPMPENADLRLLVNGNAVSLDTRRTVIDGNTYVVLDAMAKEMDPTAVSTWDPDTKTITVTTSQLTLRATSHQLYLEANGRYLYIPETVQVVDNYMMVPLTVLARAFDAEVKWDSYTGVTRVVPGSGGILSGDEFYDPDTLFWMSRVIFAESGNQPVEGQMGVAMVVNKRIDLPSYPNDIVGVLSQANQFSTYQGGALAYRTPNQSSIIAAKLVMDGGLVEELIPATHFDSLSVSWASRNLTTIKVIGGHTFYG